MCLSTRVAAACGLASLLTACAEGRFPGSSTEPPPPPDGDVVLVGAGDIARCDLQHDEATASLLDDIEGIVFTLGDNAYTDGTAGEFADCYHPSWGRHKARTRPVAGNHDYETSGASGYFGYFGAAAGDPAKGYYSYEAGDWHVVVLNSNIAASASSPQIAWLEADLATSTKRCTVAMWHHPRFSSGDHGDDPDMAPFWDVLYAGNADLILTGHDHDYERFAPQTPAAVADPVRGIRSFVVGTGGTSLRGVGSPHANSEFLDDDHHGVLRLELRDDGYRWEFVTTPDGDVLDAGTGSCH